MLVLLRVIIKESSFYYTAKYYSLVATGSSVLTTETQSAMNYVCPNVPFWGKFLGIWIREVGSNNTQSE
jgi:hypothetical protein